MTKGQAKASGVLWDTGDRAWVFLRQVAVCLGGGMTLTPAEP